MRSILFTIISFSFMLVLLAGKANADVTVFSNYGPAGEETRFGWNVGLDFATAEYRANAAKFTPTVSGILSQLDISIGSIDFLGSMPPDAEVEVTLYADGNDQPGTGIWSTVFQSLNKYEMESINDFPGAGFTFFEFDSVVPDVETVPLDQNAPMLIAGTDYWLGVQGLDGVRIPWFLSSQFNGENSVSFRGGPNQPWFTRSNDENAGLFRVAVAVPEPSSMAACAILGFLALLKRNRP